jgi:hypothetical protein
MADVHFIMRIMPRVEEMATKPRITSKVILGGQNRSLMRIAAHAPVRRIVSPSIAETICR